MVSEHQQTVLSSIKVIHLGSSPVPTELQGRSQDWWGGGTKVRWGSTYQISMFCYCQLTSELTLVSLFQISDLKFQIFDLKSEDHVPRFNGKGKRKPGQKF